MGEGIGALPDVAQVSGWHPLSEADGRSSSSLAEEAPLPSLDRADAVVAIIMHALTPS